jgi:hypothetical protein
VSAWRSRSGFAPERHLCCTPRLRESIPTASR